MKRQRHLCNYPGCDQQAKTRGLCLHHYATANDMLKVGEAEEEDLIARGFMTVRVKGGRQRGMTRYALFIKGNKTRGRGLGQVEAE